MGVCMDARNELKGKRGLVRLLNATRYSLAGYKAAWQDEEAFRQICLLAVIGLPLACWLGRDWTESLQTWKQASWRSQQSMRISTASWRQT